MPKSKLGCRTCRRRKIKCNEEFPICQQCRRSARQCDGPFRHRFVHVNPGERHEMRKWLSTNTQLPQQCSVASFSDSSEARTFHYFLTKAAPDLGGDLDADFWTVLLPQIGHGDRAIRDALLAISHLYEQAPCTFKQDSVQEMKTVSMSRCYVRSLSEFGSRIATLQCREDFQLALLSCILFANIESQQNNALNACNLLKCGLSLISRSCRKEQGELDMSNATTKTLVRMFTRQRALLAIYGHPTSYDSFEAFTGTQIDLSLIESLTRARERLYDCLNDLILLLRAARTAEINHFESQNRDTLHENQESLLKRLKLWYHEFVPHWAKGQASFTSREKSTADMMTINYEIALISVYTCLQPEIAIDQHMNRFERILVLAKGVIQRRHANGQLSAKYSPELGLIAPVFLTGWKCRHPGLRRRALSLLYQGPQQEALYSAELHAKALKAVIDIEERHPSGTSRHEGIVEGRLPSEEARVRGLTVHYETWDGVKVKPALVYQQIRRPVEGKPTWVEKRVLL